jgi:hypothetical protein
MSQHNHNLEKNHEKKLFHCLMYQVYQVYHAETSTYMTCPSSLLYTAVLCHACEWSSRVFASIIKEVSLSWRISKQFGDFANGNRLALADISKSRFKAIGLKPIRSSHLIS